MQHKSKSITLYDSGGWFVLFYLFGIPVIGSLLDYFWNYAVLLLTLRRFPPSSIKTNAEGIDLNKFIGGKRKRTYAIIITLLGFVIDWIYYDTMWRSLPGPHLLAEPVFTQGEYNPALILLSILAPILALTAVNFIISRLYFKFETKQAAILGVSMGIFTAPWLIILTKIIEGARKL